MSRTVSTPKYNKLSGLEEERGIAEQAVNTAKSLNNITDMSSDVPGTVAEKMVYNYLLRLGITFGYAYSIPAENTSGTILSYGISWKPSFYLPDYDESGIKVVFSEDIATDDDLRIYLTLNNYDIIRYGMGSTGKSRKMVFWDEQDVYKNIGFLFARDFPEIISNRIRGNVLPEIRFVSRLLQENTAASNKMQRTYTLFGSTTERHKQSFGSVGLTGVTVKEKLYASRAKKAASKLVGKETEPAQVIKKLTRQLKSSQDKYSKKIYGR